MLNIIFYLFMELTDLCHVHILELLLLSAEKVIVFWSMIKNLYSALNDHVDFERLQVC